MIDYFFLHPAGALPREERSVQSTQLNTTSGNSINTPNIYTVQGPRGRDGRDGLPGRDGRDGTPRKQRREGKHWSAGTTWYAEYVLDWFVHTHTRTCTLAFSQSGHCYIAHKNYCGCDFLFGFIEAEKHGSVSHLRS